MDQKKWTEYDIDYQRQKLPTGSRLPKVFLYRYYDSFVMGTSDRLVREM